MDEYSQTNVPSVYAIGDVTDRINLTPVALHEGMMLARTLFGGEPTMADHKNVSCERRMCLRCDMIAEWL